MRTWVVTDRYGSTRFASPRAFFIRTFFLHHFDETARFLEPGTLLVELDRARSGYYVDATRLLLFCPDGTLGTLSIDGSTGTNLREVP